MPPPRAKRPLEGLQWPLVPDSKKEGDRSTTWTNKQALASAIRVVKPELADKVLGEKQWRQKYTTYVYQHVEACLTSKQAALDSASAGLDWMHGNFEFIRDGKTMKFADAMSTIKTSFETGFIKGSKPKPATSELKVPYKGKTLQGEELIAQVGQWVSYGTIEPSAGQAILDVAKDPKARDLSDKYFVLLGAGSAMGPLHLLMELGANIVAIDLYRPGIWKRLLGIAEASCGTMTFPLKDAQAGLTGDQLYEAAGCNLLTQTPEILNWLTTVQPGKPLVVGAYAYLDGELHVRVSLAMDAIIKGLTEKRKDVMPAYLCTPTDVHVIPEEAHVAMKENLGSLAPANVAIKLSPFYLLGTLVKNPRPAVAASDRTSFRLVDGLVNKQGPNYALAKRLQHWRAMVARERQGCKVSSNIAPSTATASVTSNRLFAMAYEGMHWFVPMEVFRQETSNAVMGALLLSDAGAASGASTPSTALANPLQLFSSGSFHGGVWRMGYTIDSIGAACIAASALEQLVRLATKLLLLAAVVLAVLYFGMGKDPAGLEGVFRGEL